jgi:hypothetical protein
MRDRTPETCPDSLFGSPDWYLWDMDLQNQEGVFVRMDRASYQKSSFLDDRIQSASRERMRISLHKLWERYRELGLTPQPVRYIFHTAFCCSTLLSRALDIPGRTLVYREPSSLDGLSTYRRYPQLAPGVNLDTWKVLLRMDQTLIARGYGDEAVIVKPNDSCNNVIPDLLAQHPDNKAIVMHSDLESFLVATLKSPERRSFVRQSLPRATADAASLPALHEAGIRPLADAEVSAFVWLTQIINLQQIMGCEPARIRSLDAATLLKEPRPCLHAAASHFDLDISGEEVEQTIAGPVFQSYSKNTDVIYDAHTRARLRANAISTHGPEIEAGLRWADALRSATNWTWPLPTPLVSLA